MKDRNGRNPLFLAAQRGHTDVIDLLLKHNLDINETDNYGRTPLYIAVQMAHLRTVERICDGGADLEIADQDGRRPLLIAYKISTHCLSSSQSIVSRSADSRCVS